MKIIQLTTVFSLLLYNAREVLAEPPTKRTISEAVEQIQVPQDGISDASGILNEAAKRNIAEKLLRYSSELAVTGPEQAVGTRMASCEQTGSNANANSDKNAECNKDVYPIQIAVAIVDELGILNDSDGDGDGDEDQDDDFIDKTAGKFATGLHNSWGIGHEIPITNESEFDSSGGGGTGVLVFLSIHDRIVFISVGGALRRILTNGRIDRIMRDDMRSELKRANYEQGLINAIDEIAELLEKGEEPSMSETIWDWLFVNKELLTWISAIFGLKCFQRWKRRREQRIYAKAATRLSELDLARAEALRGSYCQATNCPICLEDFQSTKVGSDGHPVQLLRCGHVFDKTCFEEWVSSGRGNVTKCPVCRADVGSSSNSSRTRSSNQNSVPSTPTTDVTMPTDSSTNNDQNNAMDLYQQDRTFRLERLSQLYPRYITVNNLERWSSPTFDGSLARDPSFRNNDPTVAREVQGHGSSRNESGRRVGFPNETGGEQGYSFGGGTSGGGRGSRF